MDYRELSDAQLADLVRSRQGDAFAELSRRYLGLVRLKARQFEGAAPEKEDLWQEGLLGLYAAAVSFRPERGAAFSTYAGVCVQNRMASAVRRHGNSGNRPLNEALPLEDAGEAAVDQGPAPLLERREDFRDFWDRANAALTPLERRALELYLCGLGRREAAQRAGLPLRTYDNALHRARTKLKGE